MEELLKHPIYLKNYVPILSFIIGTILLFALAITRFDNLLYIGLMYVYLAIAINFIYIFYLIIQFYTKKISSNETLTRFGICTLNIPITILYIYIVFNIIL